jgi:hypothetical protein
MRYPAHPNDDPEALLDAITTHMTLLEAAQARRVASCTTAFGNATPTVSGSALASHMR